MKLDAHRTLLTSIETNLCEAERLKLLCAEAEKRVKRLKSAKFLEPATRELNELQQRVVALDSQAQKDTAKLFKDACGIKLDGIATMYDSAGNEKGTVLVEMLRVRQLADGTAVMTVAGSRIDSKMEPGNYSVLSAADILVASESQGEYFSCAI